MCELDKNIEEAIISFINGWSYCRKTLLTEVNTAGTLKSVNFQEKVYGRDLEYFYYCHSHPSSKELQSLNYPHWVTIFSNDDGMIQRMGMLGYKYRSREYLMKYSGKDQLFQEKIYKVQEVRTEEEAESINNILGFKKFNPDRIQDAQLRYYFIVKDDRPVCTGVMSIKNNVSCLDRIYTDQDYRGLGLARELCIFMLKESEQNETKTNILGSTEAGFHLYEKLGYKMIIPMHVFVKG